MRDVREGLEQLGDEGTPGGADAVMRGARASLRRRPGARRRGRVATDAPRRRWWPWPGWWWRSSAGARSSQFSTATHPTSRPRWRHRRWSWATPMRSCSRRTSTPTLPARRSTRRCSTRCAGWMASPAHRVRFGVSSRLVARKPVNTSGPTRHRSVRTIAVQAEGSAFEMVDGRMPEAPGEIAINSVVAAAFSDGSRRRATGRPRSELRVPAMRRRSVGSSVGDDEREWRHRRHAERSNCALFDERPPRQLPPHGGGRVHPSRW